MLSRIPVIICLSIIPLLVLAQTPAAAPAPETPPDQKAYSEATKISDPEKKITALEKVRDDFPKTRSAVAAEMQILSTLIQKMPDQKARIQKAAKALMARSTATDKAASKDAMFATTADRGSTATRLASQFLAANLLLKDAESYARKGVDSLVENVWMAERRDGYARSKRPVPSKEQLAKDFAEVRAGRIGTLGQVELKLGRKEQALKLLEESYKVDPSNVSVGAALGEMAAEDGDDLKAMEYLVPARLSGRATSTAIEAFEATYKKTHAGRLDGMEAMLDGEYRRRFPNPVKVAAYKAAEKRSNRMVLAEVFTGSGCPPCAGADVAFDAAMEHWGRKDLAVVMYHVHVPQPDPMTIAGNTARYKTYEVKGVPTFGIDGKQQIGGGSRQSAPEIYEGFRKDVEAELESPAEATVKIDAGLDGGTVRVRASVDDVKSNSQDLRLEVLLVQKEIRHLGENGILFHPMVVRAFGGEKGDGFPLAAGGGSTVDVLFDLDAIGKQIRKELDDYEAGGHRGSPFKFTAKKDQIDRGSLAIVAFVHDGKTKHVLQAAYTDLTAGAGPGPVTDAAGNHQ